MNQFRPLILVFLIFPTLALGSSPTSFQSHFFDASDGVEIHYYAAGPKNAEPVIFIHGSFAGAHLNWIDNKIAKTMAKTHRVYAIDLRGYGRSDRPFFSKYYGDQTWKDILEFMDHEGLQAAHFHGYSLGGEILQILLYHFQQQGTLEQKVITATFGGSGFEEVASLTGDFKYKDKEMHSDIWKRESPATGYVLDKGPYSMWTAQNMELFNPWSKEGLIKIDLTQINIPVLAIVGEYDSPNQKLTRMRRELPNYEELILTDEGHLSAITQGFMAPTNRYLEKSVQFIQSHSKSNE